MQKINAFGGFFDVKSPPFMLKDIFLYLQLNSMPIDDKAQNQIPH